MEIEILDLQDWPVDVDPVRRAARAAAGTREHAFERVVIALVDDQRITDLNRAHRGIHGPTDVLAYDGDADDPGYMGDVLISVQTAARQAAEAGRPADHEIAWLAAHGVLHLLGNDDATDAERDEMIRLQDSALLEALSGGERVDT